MKLTKLERTILINQLEIRKKLEGTDHHDRLLTILREGYSTWYDEAVAGVYEDVPEPDCDFVLEVLSMYRAIEWYKEDSGDALDKEPFSKFAGFDGNNEGPLLRFARFEIRGEDKWDEQKPHARSTDNFNSHMPMREIYGRMLIAFKALGPAPRLTKEDVTKVLAASRR